MSIVSPQRFCHVVYRTRRFDDMLQWYTTVFGARTQHRDPVLAFLTYDDEHHRFAFVNLAVLQPDAAETGRSGLVGVDHVAYSFGSLTDLFDHYARLKEHGIRPYWCIHHGITISMYYGDPDGNQMEFQVDCFASNDAANAFMAGPHFAQNPIGVEYDPEQWLARLRAGEPPESFLERREHLPVSPVRGAAGAPA